MDAAEIGPLNLTGWSQAELQSLWRKALRDATEATAPLSSSCVLVSTFLHHGLVLLLSAPQDMTVPETLHHGDMSLCPFLDCHLSVALQYFLLSRHSLMWQWGVKFTAEPGNISGSHSLPCSFTPLTFQCWGQCSRQQQRRGSGGRCSIMEEIDDREQGDR